MMMAIINSFPVLTAYYLQPYSVPSVALLSLLLLVAFRLLLPEVLVVAISLLDLKSHQQKQTELQHLFAVPSFSLLTRQLHHSELFSSDLQQPLILHFSIFQAGWISVSSICTVQQQLLVMDIDVGLSRKCTVAKRLNGWWLRSIEGWCIRWDGDLWKGRGSFGVNWGWPLVTSGVFVV